MSVDALSSMLTISCAASNYIPWYVLFRLLLLLLAVADGAFGEKFHKQKWHAEMAQQKKWHSRAVAQPLAREFQ